MTTAERIVHDWNIGVTRDITAECVTHDQLVSEFDTVKFGQVVEVYIFEDGSSVEVYGDDVKAVKP